MAKALQCPTCGTKKRIDALTDGASFRCEQCGQVLKVPPGLQAGPKPSAPTPAATPAATPRQPATSGGAPLPAPRRRSRPTMTAGGAAAGAGGTAVLSSTPSPGIGAPAIPPATESARGAAPGGERAARSDRGRGGRGGREALPVPLRVLAWLVALPLGLAIVGFPARKAGYLSSQKLLDVIVKSDLTRFVPIVVIVVLWALVSAALVTLFVEGGRRLMVRRRARHADRASAAPAAAVPKRGARTVRT